MGRRLGKIITSYFNYHDVFLSEKFATIPRSLSTYGLWPPGYPWVMGYGGLWVIPPYRIGGQPKPMGYDKYGLLGVWARTESTVIAIKQGLKVNGTSHPLFNKCHSNMLKMN
jgi:hypothetical protein